MLDWNHDKRDTLVHDFLQAISHSCSEKSKYMTTSISTYLLM